MSETPIDPSDLDRHRDRFRERLATLKSLSELKALGDEYLGRKSGLVTAFMGKLREVSKDAKRDVGARINAFKDEIEARSRQSVRRLKRPSGRPGRWTSRSPAVCSRLVACIR